MPPENWTGIYIKIIDYRIVPVQRYLLAQRLTQHHKSTQAESENFI